MKYHAGILRGTPDWDDRYELAILAHTPGVPREWIYAVFDAEWRKRHTLRDVIDRTDNPEFHKLGRDNFESVDPGDGLNMLRAVGPTYAGAVPLAAQLDLRNDQRSDGEIAREFGVSRRKVQRWRTKAVFDPLTGVRLIPNRGTPLV